MREDEFLISLGVVGRLYGMWAEVSTFFSFLTLYDGN